MVHSMPPIVVKTLEMEWCVSGGTQFHADITQINKKKKNSRAVATGGTTNIQVTTGDRQLLTALLGRTLT